MQPLDRYLSNLAKLLPADQREDILRELSEDIRSEFEDKESELGRPLTEPEQLEILKRRGNPLQVAAGYTPNQGTLSFGPQLIGPVLFPFYVRVLTFNLGLTFLIVGAIFGHLSCRAANPFRRSFFERHSPALHPTRRRHSHLRAGRKTSLPPAARLEQARF